MTDIKSELASFQALGVDDKQIVEAQDVVEALEKLISDNTKAMMALRPGVKDYDKQVTDFTNKTNAYESQLTQARLDLDKAVKELKLQVLGDIGKYLNPGWQELRNADAAIINSLLKVRDLVQKRGELTVSFDAKRAILDDWNYQLQAGKGGRDSKLPWRKDYPTPWSNALREYIRRFLELAGDNGNRPVENQDVLEWVAKR